MNEQIVNGLVGLRTAVGAGAWLAPRLSARMFGLDPAGNPQAPYLGRLFGVRDVALALGTSSSSGSDRARGCGSGWPATSRTRSRDCSPAAAASCPSTPPCS